MSNSLVFKKLVNKNIFSDEFKDFNENNELLFPDKGICVLYGPNGTGKTSFVNILNNMDKTEYHAIYNGEEYTSSVSNNLFFIINDQNNRNIIKGETQDFLLGDNIRREYLLKHELEESYNKIVNELISTFKTNFNLSSKTSKLMNFIEPNIKNFVADIVNTKSKGKNYNINDLLTMVDLLSNEDKYDYDDSKFKFFIDDFAGKKSIVEEVLNISTSQITINARINEIEENDEAIKILNKFLDKDECIVCDSKGIDPKALVEEKQKNKQKIIDSIDKKLRATIEDVISISPEQDPFCIKKILLGAINDGNFANLLKLQEELKLYKEIFKQETTKAVRDAFKIEGLKEKNDEYNTILAEKPKHEEEDIIYIQEIISKSMEKELKIVRDSNQNLRILLSDREFLNVERGELPLSAGEQNFLSLTFEFLKAKNTSSDIIVIDDPISSFDSIYKNKIVFSLVRMLESKKRLILTHNLDLVRLLNGQYSNCFNLYILENSKGSTAHGFIPLKEEEKEMLIDLNKLLTMFRENIFDKIINSQAYLLSMIPFMRGYANIINDRESFTDLTKVMHGYKTGKVDIAKIYFKLFGTNGSGVLPAAYEVSVQDILSYNIDTVDIINTIELPLLNKTLKHTFNYLYLRLLVEKTLVDKYKINTNKHSQLGDIIAAAFRDNTNIHNVKRRVFLTSKKTLINEFNHFEGNLSIFQPAIDITDTALAHEKADIITFVNSIKVS